MVLHNVIVFHYLHLCVLLTALNYAGAEKQVESFSWGGKNLSFICCPLLLLLSQFFFCSLSHFAQIYFLLTNSWPSSSPNTVLTKLLWLVMSIWLISYCVYEGSKIYDWCFHLALIISLLQNIMEKEFGWFSISSHSKANYWHVMDHILVLLQSPLQSDYSRI